MKVTETQVIEDRKEHALTLEVGEKRGVSGGIVNGWHGEWGWGAGRNKMTEEQVVTALQCHLKEL